MKAAASAGTGTVCTRNMMVRLPVLGGDGGLAGRLQPNAEALPESAQQRDAAQA